MKYSKKLSVLFIFIALLLSSCFRGEKSKLYNSAYINYALNDSTSPAYHTLKNTHIDKLSAICIIGSPAECLPIAQSFVQGDQFDNIDGHYRSDTLADFSGEKIQAILDLANSPYFPYLKENNQAYLNELHLRNFVFALDSNYLYSPFDKKQIEKKSPAKIVIFASDYSDNSALKSVDSLIQAAKLNVKVFSPLKAIYSYIRDLYPQQKTILFWTNAEKDSSKIYSKSFEEYYPNASQYKLRNFLSNPKYNLEHNLLNIINLYISNSDNEKLSYIIVDNPKINVAQLNSLIEYIRKSKNDSYLPYQNVLDKNFRFITPQLALHYEVFRYMRKHNLFAHRIAKPSFTAYITWVSPKQNINYYNEDGFYTYNYKYKRACGEKLNNWNIVALRGKLISDSLRKSYSHLVPTLAKEYVQE